MSIPLVDQWGMVMGTSGSKLEKMLGDQFPEGERYFGLENFGNTCYCNSVLQVDVLTTAGRLADTSVIVPCTFLCELCEMLDFSRTVLVCRHSISACLSGISCWNTLVLLNLVVTQRKTF